MNKQNYLIALIVLILLISGCNKKNYNNSPEDLKKKELELKEKQLDSLENEIKKDSIE